MELARSVRSLWAGARKLLAGSQKTTVVICPTVEMPAQIGLNAAQQMESCSRWPELAASCTQDCMSQVKFSDGELQHFLERYEGKQCGGCGSVLTGDDWYKSRLAIFETQRTTTECAVPPSLSPEDETPICSDCYRTKTQI